jgi:hypothetical protein
MQCSSELSIPPEAQADARAVELVRVWAAGGKQHVSLATGLWNDPAAWGILLVDLARHVADAYGLTQGLEPSVVLHRVKAGFDAEWSNPTDKPCGKMLE